MNLAWWLNTAWMWKCRGEAARFAGQCRCLAATQARLLGEIVRRNRHTWFGRLHDFTSIESPRDFQRAVPPAGYADFAPAIERIAAGEANVLTREPVLLLEPTSGSTGAEKLIPYTASLRRQFQRAIAVWIADLFDKMPAVRAGRAYWSISPALGSPRRSAGGLPIGFDEDAAYLGGLERLALTRLLVVPSDVARLHDIDEFRYVTLLHLLHARDLSLISVWNPTFLTALLASFEEWQERLCRDLRHGSVSDRSGTSRVRAPRVALNPRRAEEVASLMRSARTHSELFSALWPHLALISCWADAAARQQVDSVQALFPGVAIQPKGLLATEGCVSIPLVGQDGAALAMGAHFFEFQEEGEQGRFRLAHELERGGRYRVLITTGGGLYRYQLHDLVEIVGFHQQCPLLRFLGKADRVSDLVGEKLAEPHVRDVLERICRLQGLAPSFTLLVPVLARSQPPRYRLYLQGCQPKDIGGFTAALAAGLAENPHYRYAVALGQLRQAEVVLLPEETPAHEIVAERWHERGGKAGALKPAVLDGWTGWPERLTPHHQPPRAADRRPASRLPAQEPIQPAHR